MLKTQWRSSSGDPFGRKIYIAIIICMAFPALFLFGFPEFVSDMRCCLRFKSEKGLFNALFKMRDSSRALRHRKLSELAGHRSFIEADTLESVFLFGTGRGPRFERAIADLRGAVFTVRPRQGGVWELPVGGTPGVEPAWSNKVKFIAFYRLNRLWLSDALGLSFIDLGRLPADFVPAKIKWRCDGLAVAIGAKNLGWKIFPLESKDVHKKE